MHLTPRWRRGSQLLVLAVAVAACSSTPTATPGPTASPTPTPEPTATPSPTPPPVIDFPLAVVTGYTNLRSAVALAELRAMPGLVVPCGLDASTFEDFEALPDCLPADQIVGHLAANPGDLALLPPGLVVPEVRVLSVDGADLFGGPEARAEAYPLIGHAAGLPAEWTAHDAAEIRTLISLGDSCPDRGVAFQAITVGKGWDWVFGGGTAEYTRVYPNPVPPGYVGNGWNIVDAVPTGNEGAVARLVSGADVTMDDFECPVVDDFSVNQGVVFSIDPAVLPRLHDTYGVDVATLAANHLFDRGQSGFLQTLEQFTTAGIPTTGAGADLDAALEPAIVEANGLTFGFVAFNEIPGSVEAAPGQPGVAWLRDPNVFEAVDRARAVADIVICVPQWWGGAEYHAEFRGDMRRQQAVFFDAGCDHIVGHGTHWSGPIELTDAADGTPHVTMVSHGNFLFGQEWSQQTQEGVILELAFRGTRLAQARLHPYVMLEQAQANLTDPQTDGAYVLNRIYAASGLIEP